MSYWDGGYMGNLPQRFTGKERRSNPVSVGGQKVRVRGTSVASQSICGSLLPAPNDRRLLPEIEIVGALRDAGATLENAAIPAEANANRQMDRAAAALINGLIAGEDSVRRRKARDPI